MELKSFFMTLMTVLCTSFTCLIGGWDYVINILAIFIILDYMSGVMRSIKLKQLDSQVGFIGILKKGAIFVVVILANQLDYIFVKDTPILRTMVCYFYIANEGISITENLTILGVPMPRFITTSLNKLKENNSSFKENS
ncbi:phage holin family protein [Marinisporobacter balticus]|uniref:Cph1 family holin n=1 Tax=Marinisporobacter balticus TaxID=2018667 RepID=A0A4R2KAZ8_9FIRM|nr:phage holin family protein [Marinisporobacter balticus]TCO70633.1 Cph1 family holin [Marinisporobacter balticus]